jgi:Kef-type K+ transport system membrane component KefB
MSGSPVPPIAAHPFLIFLLQLATLLLLAWALGRLATRLGMPAVVGELGTGVLLGPSVLGHLDPAVSDWLLPRDAAQFHLLDAVGQVGVLLLVAVTGMGMDLRLVRRLGPAAARISIAGLAVPLALGVGLGLLLADRLTAPGRDPVVFALFVGVALCVSAIPVIAKILIDLGLLHRDVGQLTLAAATVDDVAGWLMLSIVSTLATSGVQAWSLLMLPVFVAFAVVAGPPIVRLAARCPSPTAPVVAFVLAGAALTQALGIEAVFGAFTCGILLGANPAFAPARVAALRTVTLAVLAPIFFATAGLRIDLTALGDPVVLRDALAVLLVAVAGKFAGAFAGALASRLTRWEALALGAGLNSRGVIEVVVAMVGLRLGILTTTTYTIVVLVAVATSLMAPPILRYAMSRIPQTPAEAARALQLEHR